MDTLQDAVPIQGDTDNAGWDISMFQNFCNEPFLNSDTGSPDISIAASKEDKILKTLRNFEAITSKWSLSASSDSTQTKFSVFKQSLTTRKLSSKSRLTPLSEGRSSISTNFL
jgi:hypothetical protein